MNNINVAPGQENLQDHARSTVFQMFTRTSAKVVYISLAIISFVWIFRTVIAGFNKQTDAWLTCLYYGLEKNQALVINFTAGGIISFCFILLTIGFFSASAASASEDPDAMIRSLKALRGSLVISLIVAVTAVFVSFCSVSVMYQSYRIDPEALFAFINGMDSNSLFAYTAVIGILVIAILAGLIVLTSSLIRSSQGSGYFTSALSGTLFMCFAGILIMFVLTVIFISRLVMPPEIGRTIDLAHTGCSALDTVIAGVSVILFSAVFNVFDYYSKSASFAMDVSSGRYIPYRAPMIFKNHPYNYQHLKANPQHDSELDPSSVQSVDPDTGSRSGKVYRNKKQ